jgi:hypothetical protein
MSCCFAYYTEFVLQQLSEIKRSFVCMLPGLTLESFPKEFEESKVLYWYGVDKEDRKICE